MWSLNELGPRNKIRVKVKSFTLYPSVLPRIYVYKITFVDQPYWYWGWHKEKKFDEFYMGSPATNKTYWDLYKPVKEIIEFFEFSEEGERSAQITENRLIKPDINNPLCLNEHYGGVVSSKVASQSAKRRWENPKERECHSVKMKKKWEEPEYREKVSLKVRKKWEEPEYRDKVTESGKEKLKDPECRDKMIRKAKERWEDPEYRENQSCIIRERWKDPNYRDKVITSQRETFSRNGHQRGEKNSQFGTMWITNGTKGGNKKIRKGDEIPPGFYPGMTRK